jgi:hypothetical protein
MKKASIPATDATELNFLLRSRSPSRSFQPSAGPIAPRMRKSAACKLPPAKNWVVSRRTCAMLKPLVDYILDLLNIARDTRANKEEIAALRGEVDELASAVEKISYEIRSVREEERHEREKLLLRLENTLLRIEKQIPSAKETKRVK